MVILASQSYNELSLRDTNSDSLLLAPVKKKVYNYMQKEGSCTCLIKLLSMFWTIYVSKMWCCLCSIIFFFLARRPEIGFA